MCRETLKKHDIVCLQETWLQAFENNILEDLMPEFSFACKTSMKSHHCHVGRPYGGIAILWKTKLDDYIEYVDTAYENMQMIKLRTDDGIVLVVNVYFPVNTHENNELISDYI